MTQEGQKMRYGFRVAGLAALFILIDMKFAPFGLRTDLASLLVFWFGLTHSYSKGMLFGAAIGFVEDSLYGAFIGPAFLAKGMVGFFAAFLSRGFFQWTPFLGFAGAMGLTIMGGLVEFASMSVFDESFAGGFWGKGLYMLALQGFINGMIGIFLKPASDES